MKKLFVIISLVTSLTSCVKDPQGNIDLKKIAKITINDQENYKISANPEILYKISFELTDDNNAVDNSVNAIFSVDNGKLIDLLDLTKESNTITVKIKNRTAEVLYRPLAEVFPNAQLVIFVDPFKMIKVIELEPITPEIFQFEQEIYTTNKAAPLDISVILKSSKGKVSTGLDVDFVFKDVGKNNSIIKLSPNTTKTTLGTGDLFTKAITKVENINQITDTINVFIRYQGAIKDTATIYFHD